MSTSNDSDPSLQHRDTVSTAHEPASNTPTLGNAESVIPASIPSVLGRYTLGVRLGSGGMGTVYEATDTEMGRRVAIKVLQDIHSEEQRIRFRREAQSAAKLKHPSILTVHGNGEEAGIPYVVMPLVRGPSLAQYLRSGQQDLRQSVALLASVARALHSAHEQGIVHRDVKPSNILLETVAVGFHPWLTDFGLARDMNDNAGLSLSGQILGSPSYMAPEQAAGRREDVGAATDVYALGAILYEILTGRPPFQEESLAALLRAIRFEEPLRPRSLAAHVPLELEAIALKALSKSRLSRYDSAAEFAEELDAWLAGRPVRARNPNAFQRACKWIARHPAVAAVALLAIGVVATGIWFGAEAIAAERKMQLEKETLIEKQRTENIAASKDAAQAGRRALEGGGTDEQLLNAEDSFRIALVRDPQNADALNGLRESALRQFHRALTARNWSQARAKLFLAETMQAPESEVKDLRARLEAAESEQGNRIRARIETLVTDARKPVRTLLHAQSVAELISMKCPEATEVLLPLAEDPVAPVRLLAIEALTWYGDVRALPRIRPFIEKRLPDGSENSVAIQVAALRALGNLDSTPGTEFVDAVCKRIRVEPEGFTSQLYEDVSEVLDPYLQRKATQVRTELEKNRASTSTDSWLLQAQRHLYAKQFSEAIICADRVLAQEPESVQAHLLRAQGHRESNNADAALADFTRAIELDSGNPEYARQRGSLNFKLARYEAARDDFTTYLKAFPQNVDARMTRGQAYRYTGAYDEALLDFRAVLADSNRAAEAYENIVETQSSHGRFEEAFETCAQAIQSAPGNPSYFALRAGIHSTLGKFKACIEDLDKALRLQPNNAEYFMRRAEAHAALKNEDAFKADMGRALEVRSSKWMVHVRVLNSYRAIGKLDLAEAALKRAVDTGPNAERVLTNRAFWRYRHRDLQGCREDLQRAREVSPDQPSPDFHAGMMALNEGKFTDARIFFERSRKIYPTWALPLAMCGYLSALSGDFAAADRDLDRANKQAPSDYQIWECVARVDLLRQKTDAALEKMNVAVQRTPGKADAFSSRALLRLSARQDVAGARADVNRGVELAPGLGTLRISSGFIHLLEGRPDQTRSDFAIDTTRIAVEPNGNAMRVVGYAILGDRAGFDQAVKDMRLLHPAWTCLITEWQSVYEKVRGPIPAQAQAWLKSEAGLNTP